MIQQTFRRCRPWARVLGPVFFFSALSLALLWPLPLHMTSTLIGIPGDSFYFVWLIGWIQKAIFQLHVSPMFVPFLNYPEGWNLAYTDIAPTMMAIALPGSLIAGPTFGYNFAVVVSYVLSGLGAYLWVHRLTKNAAAGLIAGTIFAFCPYRDIHLLDGHLNLMGTQWFPFYFLFLHEFLEAPRWAWKRAILAALFLGLIALTSEYYLYEALVLSCVYILVYFLVSNWRSLTRWVTWARLVGLAGLAAPLVLLSVLPFLQLARQGGLVTRVLESDTFVNSASPTDFFLPAGDHFGWGSLFLSARAEDTYRESTLYLGVITLALCVLAFVKRKQLSEGHRRMAKLLPWAAGVAFVLAMGTGLHWLAGPVTISVPQFIQQWHPFEQTFVPLPGYFLLRFAPFYGVMRVWMRYGIFVALFASILAGVGSAWLFSKLKRRWVVPVAVILLTLIVVDFFPSWGPLCPVEGRPVDAWLASQPGQGITAQFPSYRMGRGNYYYYAGLEDKPMLGGWFGPFLTLQGRELQPVLATFPDETSLDLLRKMEVQYLVVDEKYYKDDLGNVEAAIEKSGFESKGSFDGQLVFERSPGASG
jgi:hypothetical protein